MNDLHQPPVQKLTSALILDMVLSMLIVQSIVHS